MESFGGKERQNDEDVGRRILCIDNMAKADHLYQLCHLKACDCDKTS